MKETLRIKLELIVERKGVVYSIEGEKYIYRGNTEHVFRSSIFKDENERGDRIDFVEDKDLSDMYRAVIELANRKYQGKNFKINTKFNFIK